MSKSENGSKEKRKWDEENGRREHRCRKVCAFRLGVAEPRADKGFPLAWRIYRARAYELVGDRQDKVRREGGVLNKTPEEIRRR